jgi:hypothetical protein
VETRFGPFGDSANLEIIFDAPDGTLMWLGHMESRFGLFGDSVSVGEDRCTVRAKRTVHSEIVLDTPDGTPKWRGSSGSSFQSVWR